ncbi:MAG TPA: cupin domain-containing protein [Pseudonocardiaceae bacterium]|jgi:hypothetical protein|nr:cupin domain-containing protein [Pseudonocardiaceae bacterium]
MSEPTIPDWAADLGLTAHPEGGFYAETWRTELTVPATALPAEYGTDRAGATGIYFLLAAGQRSAWHLVRSDELWLWHRGDSVVLLLGGSGRTPGEVTELRLGPAVERGERPQVRVPGGVWQATRPVADAVLVSCVVSPGFDYADFRLDP